MMPAVSITTSPSSPTAGQELARAKQQVIPPELAVRGGLPLGLNLTDAARLIGVSQSHWYELLAQGLIGPSTRKLGRRKLYDADEVVAWWRAGCPSRETWMRHRRK